MHGKAKMNLLFHLLEILHSEELVATEDNIESV